MPEKSKTEEELNREVAALRQRVAALEITEAERQRIEAALRESEKKYRQVVENAAEVIYTTDAKGNLTYANSAGLKIAGYSLEELQRFNYLDLVLPEHQQRVAHISAEQFRKRQATSYVEFPFLSKAGKVIWFGQNASLVIEDGKVVGFHVIARDITERKQVEEALRRSEERYRTIIESIWEGYYEVDLAGNFTFVNDAVSKHLGYSVEELIGMNYRQFTDEETARESYQIYNTVYRTGEPSKGLDIQLIRKDGTKRFFEILAFLIKDSQGKPIGFRGVSWDVTERKGAEEALKRSEEEAKRLAQENAVMAEIGRIISSTLNIEEVYEPFAEEVRKLMHFERININIINSKENTLTILYVAGRNVADRRAGDVVPLAGTGAEWVRQNRSHLLIQEENRDEIIARLPGLLPLFKAGLRSIMLNPLISKDEVIGVLDLQTAKPNAYTEVDLKLAERVSNQIAGAIANVQLFLGRKRAEEALQRSEEVARRLAQENAVMAEIGRIISSTLNIEDVYERFAEEAHKLIPFDRIMINLADLKNRTSTPAYAAGIDVPGRRVGDVTPLATTVTEEVIRTRSSLLIQVDNDNIDEVVSRFPPLLVTFQAGLRSIIFVPLISKDQVIGVLSLRSLVPKAYTDQNVRLAESIGTQIAGAIANVQLFLERKRAEEAFQRSEEVARRLAQENAIIAEIGRIISSTLNIEEIYERFAEEVRKLLPFDRIMVALNNPGEGTATVTYASGFGFEGRGVGDVYPLANSGHEEVMRTRAGLLLQPETMEELGSQFPTLLSTFQAGLRSIMSVPLISRDQVIGALHFRSKKSKAYSDRDLRLAERIAAQIAGAIANAHLFLERERAVEALREREERYRTILETMEEGYYEVDLHGRFTLFNEAMRKMHGFSKEEMLGMSYKEFMSKETAQMVYQTYNAVHNTGQPVKLVEWEIIKGNGEKATMEASVYLVKNAQGERIGFRGIERDATERKKVEAALQTAHRRLQDIIEFLPDATFVVDNDRKVVAWNRAIEEMTGVNKKDIVGQGKYAYALPFFGQRRPMLIDLIFPENQDAEKLFPDLQKKEGKLYQEGSFRCGPSGNGVFLWGVASPLLDSEGNLVGAIQSLRDITDQKRTYVRLLQSEKMASIGQLAAGVAHEINNPTGFVSSNLKTLGDYLRDIQSLLYQYQALVASLKEHEESTARPASILKQVDTILSFQKEADIEYILSDISNLIKESQEGTERIKKIVMDLKNFAHPGDDKMKPADINKNLDSTLNVVWNELKYKATIKREYGNIPAIRCYPQQLNQVFLNLLVNAAQAIKEKGEIYIRTQTHNGQVEVQISDTGAGIPPENLSKLFDPFFTTKEVGQGTGLGLNVAYNIVKKHNGTIDVKSEVGKGTTFTIRIPMSS